MLTNLLSNLVITRVHSISTMYTPENAQLTRNDRPSWAVVSKYEGETIYTSKEKRIKSDLNHFVILPKGCSYDWQCTQAGHFTIIEFDCDLTYDTPFSFYVKHAEGVLKKFKDMEYKRNLKSPMVEIESIMDTYAIILSLVHSNRENYLSSKKHQIIAPALEYISHHYNQTITNDMLAEITGFSNVYFRKLFTHIMGMPPIAYVHELRIEKAKEMLKSDYSTLSDIALSLGYSSLYDFSRDFKKRTGISPSKYAGKSQSVS